MKLQSLEFDVSDVIPTNIQNISPVLILHTYVHFMENGTLSKLRGFFNYFLQSYEITKS